MARPRLPRVPIGPRLQPAPARPPAVSPAAPPSPRPPIAPATRPPVAVTAPLPLPTQPPAGLDSKQLADWHVAQVHAHERLRTLSFYDTGHHLMQLLAMREHFGARDIKELCSKVDLGMSHMTANKYLQVARAFDRDTALRIGIEKCYALTVYAKATGRAGQAAAILASDEPVRGERGLRVSSASASRLYGAVKTLKEAARANREPTEIQAAREATAKATGVLVKQLGFRGAKVEVVRRGGEPRIAIFISLEVAEKLDVHALRAIAKAAPRIARRRPELLEPLRRAGWRLGGSG